MKIVVSLAVTAAAIALLSAACTRKKDNGEEAPPPPAPPQATADAMVPAAARPVVQTPCVASRPASGNPENAPVPPGTYCVCDPGPAGADVHESVKGVHLNTGDTVAIGEPDDGVKVTLNGQDFTFISSADGAELGAMINFPHETASIGGGASTTGEQGMETHLVQVSRPVKYEPPLGAGVPKCHPEDKSKTIIRIAFCYWGKKPGGDADAPDEWVCPADVPSTHLGDAHAEN